MDELSYSLLEYPDFIINGGKRIRCKGIGEKFAAINSFFLEYLKGFHIPVALIKQENSNSLRFIKSDNIPFSVKITNNVDKKMALVFNKGLGDQLQLPVFEVLLNSTDETFINESYITAFNLCSIEEFKIINRLCSKINAVLKSYFERRNLVLSRFSCSFSKVDDKILVTGDFTPKGLVISPNDQEVSFPELKTAAEIKNYTEYIYNLMSN